MEVFTVLCVSLKLLEKSVFLQFLVPNLLLMPGNLRAARFLVATFGTLHVSVRPTRQVNALLSWPVTLRGMRR